MLNVFIDCKGVVHHEFLPGGQTANKEYYLGAIRRSLRKAVSLNGLELWGNTYDNASAHNALIIREFLATNNTNTFQ